MDNACDPLLPFSWLQHSQRPASLWYMQDIFFECISYTWIKGVYVYLVVHTMAREKARREWNWEHLFEASRRVYSKVTALQGGLFQKDTLYGYRASCTYKVNQDMPSLGNIFLRIWIQNSARQVKFLKKNNVMIWLLTENLIYFDRVIIATFAD